MSEFDSRARLYDSNPLHLERAVSVAGKIKKLLPSSRGMRALDFGAGTGSLSLLLADWFSEIIMMDTSSEMVKVMEEKVEESGINNLKPLFFDLENNEYINGNVDVIFSQMVMHHIIDTEVILKKFYNILNRGGLLVIADLYSEDGSFHGEGFIGHNGFDVEQLKAIAKITGFSKCYHEDCFIVKKPVGDEIKEFPMFILISEK